MKRTLIVLSGILCIQAGLVGQDITQTRIASAEFDYIADVIRHVSDTAIAADVRHLESYGTRHAQFTHRHAIAEWLKQRFLDVGVAQVEIDSFQEATYNTWQKNVIATIPGSSTGEEELIIGAHYDSQSYLIQAAPGADDNASGTAGIIEMARVLRAVDYQPRATIRFVAFAAEELGLYGSYDYADKAMIAGSNILLMQNYDMIAYRDQTVNDRNVAINMYQGAYDEAVLDSTLMATYTTLTPHLTTENIRRSDSWPFALRMFKAVFVIEDEEDFNPHYHWPQDSSTYLDFTYAAEIIQSGIALTLTLDSKITDVAAYPNDLPGTWSLEQNYPNPFNPVTQIQYTMSEEGRVRLWVHTLLGETIAELDGGWKPAGTHTVRWMPDCASGVYYYTLEVASGLPDLRVFRTSKKMMLIR